jgi:hypothetical protein
VYLIEHLVKYQREKYHERYLIMACELIKDGMHTTNYCCDIQLNLADEASKRQVKVIELTYPTYKARVQSSFSAPIVGYLEV